VGARTGGPRAPGAEAGGAAQHLLLTGSAAEVLARIVPEDPLGLRARIGVRLEERALLLDPEGVLLAAQALCALHAPLWRGEPRLDTWLEERVEEALAECLAEDALGPPRASAGLEAFARPLSLEPVSLAAACARFHRLPFEAREAFFALVLDARAPERLARARGLSLSDLARRARAALELFRPT
jgi:hypothetical protein